MFSSLTLSITIFAKVDPTTQAVSVFAGSLTGLSGTANAVGTAARFFRPYDITSDGTSLFVTDNSNCLIRKIDIATAAVSTIRGNRYLCLPSAMVPAPQSTFAFPQGITTDGTKLYVIENTVVRQVNVVSGAVTTFAGSTAGVVGHIDAIGTLARFNNLEGITTDGTIVCYGSLLSGCSQDRYCDGWRIFPGRKLHQCNYFNFH